MPPPPLPADQATAAAALHDPSALEALSSSIQAAARDRDGAQAAAASISALAAAVKASPAPLPPACLPHLTALLTLPPLHRHPRRAARAAATTAVTRLAAALGASATILPALRAAALDTAPEVREAAVRGAGRTGDEAATAVLLAGAADGDAGVAAAAVEGLAGLEASAPDPTWHAWAAAGAASALPFLRPLTAAVVKQPRPPLPPRLMGGLLQQPTLTPAALWGLATLAGPAALTAHAPALISALDAGEGGDTLCFAAQAVGAAVPPPALAQAAFKGDGKASLTVRACLLFGMVVAGRTLTPDDATAVAGWLEGRWARAVDSTTAAAALLQAACLAAHAAGPGTPPRTASRLWSVAVRAAGSAGPAGPPALASLVAALGGCTAAWAEAAVARLVSAGPPTDDTVSDVEAVLLAAPDLGRAVAGVVGWVEAAATTTTTLAPPARSALLRLVGRLAAVPAGAAVLGGSAGLADRCAACLLIPTLTQPKVGGGSVRAAAAVVAELTAHLFGQGGPVDDLAAALAAAAPSDVDPRARAASCSALGALLTHARLQPAAAEAAAGALAAALDDARDGPASEAVRAAAAASLRGLEAVKPGLAALVGSGGGRAGLREEGGCYKARGHGVK